MQCQTLTDQVDASKLAPRAKEPTQMMISTYTKHGRGCSGQHLCGLPHRFQMQTQSDICLLLTPGTECHNTTSLEACYATFRILQLQDPTCCRRVGACSIHGCTAFSVEDSSFICHDWQHCHVVEVALKDGAGIEDSQYILDISNTSSCRGHKSQSAGMPRSRFTSKAAISRTP